MVPVFPRPLSQIGGMTTLISSNPRFAGIWSIKGGNKFSDLINPLYLSDEIDKKNRLKKVYVPTLKVFEVDVLDSWH